jgi:hypothetical protein
MAEYLDKTEKKNTEQTECAVSAGDEEMFEHCVLCGRKINIRKDVHISSRTYYIEGCGQLCRECFISLHEGGDK